MAAATMMHGWEEALVRFYIYQAMLKSLMYQTFRPSCEARRDCARLFAQLGSTEIRMVLTVHIPITACASLLRVLITACGALFQAAEVPIIVAINKIDKEGANVERVKQMLAEQGLLPEEWGGETPMIPVSAHTGQGIPELLENLSLLAETPSRPPMSRRTMWVYMVDGEACQHKVLTPETRALTVIGPEE
eukprot:9504191-Pyramimonas_sp.AAC.2